MYVCMNVITIVSAAHWPKHHQQLEQQKRQNIFMILFRYCLLAARPSLYFIALFSFFAHFIICPFCRVPRKLLQFILLHLGLFSSYFAISTSLFVSFAHKLS